MGCGDTGPVDPDKHYLDWEIADPSEETPERVRAIVDDIDARVQALWGKIRS
jgi:hypothetical protein